MHERVEAAHPFHRGERSLLVWERWFHEMPAEPMHPQPVPRHHCR